MVTAALIPICALAVDWRTGTIAEYNDYYDKLWSRLDMDYDANGNDHIVWIDWIDAVNDVKEKYIYYTYLPNPRGGNPGNAFTELVDSIFSGSGVAIAVDRNADPPIPYILYSDDENPAHVILASRVNGIWTYEIVRTFPEDPGEPYEVGDEIGYRINSGALAVGDDHGVHAAYNVWFEIVDGFLPNGTPTTDSVKDVAYATKPLGGTWELTNWLGTREFWNDPKQRNRYQQEGPDLVLGPANEPYISFCEYEYDLNKENDPSYIFIAYKDRTGAWAYEQVLEMDRLGGYWFYTENTSLANKAVGGPGKPRLHLAFIAQNGDPNVTLGPARTYYVTHDGAGWVKDLVYEFDVNTPVFDIDVLNGSYGAAVAFGEYGGAWPEATVYASLYARDPSNNWVDILNVDRNTLSGNSITAAVKPDGYTDVLYPWGYTYPTYASGYNDGREAALLKGSFEVPGSDFTSGPGGGSLSIKPELERVFSSPNPASDALNLKFVLSCPGLVKISTYDLAGRKVHATLCRGNAGENTLVIPVAEWPPGVYIYDVVCGDSRKTGKAVISR